MAVQRHQVHRAVPRGADDLVVRLRVRRQRAARQEVLRPAHRQRHGPRRGLAGRAHADPEADQPGQGVTKYIAAAFPSACGKTNLAMLEPTIPGWKVESIGDDIAWMRIGDDGRLWAVNPEYGFFGVAPGTNEHTNPNAMRTINMGNSVFTNVALTDDGDIWWEGMENTPAHATSWKGEDWTPESPTSCPATRTAATARRSSSARSWRPSTTTRAASRSTRSCSVAVARPRSRWSPRPATGCTAPSWAPRCRARPPRPPSARSASYAATRWRCCRSSATTPATTSTTGSRSARRTTPPSCRSIFYVNWFRRDDDGGFLWPGFGENSRVLKWVVERIEGQAAAVETPIGHVPTPEALDIDGLDMTPEQIEAALAVDLEEWKAELPQIRSGSRSSATSCPPCCGPSSTGCAPAWGSDTLSSERHAGPATAIGRPRVSRVWRVP